VRTHHRHRRIIVPGLFALVVAFVFGSTPLVFAQEGGTDHFKCYVAKELTLEPFIVASVEDQFAGGVAGFGDRYTL